MFEGCKKWTLTNENSIILAIIVFAGALRGYNLFHGEGFHPDERGIQMITSNLSWQNLNAQNFHYGSFAYYLCWFTSKLLSIFWSNADSYDFRFELGRCFAVLFGCLAVGGIYVLARLISFDFRIPFLAAFFLATNVFHLQLSRFYTVDILLTTISIVSLYCCCRLVDNPQFNKFFAISFGLAFANKIAALTLLIPYSITLLLLLFRKSVTKGLKLATRRVLELIVISGLTVLIVEPFMFLDFDKFVADNRTQIDMVKGSWVPPYTLQYVDTVPYLYHLKQMFFYTVGLPLAPLALIGLFLVVLDLRNNLNYKHLVILSWFFAVFLSIAGMQVKFPRYLLSLYPLICFFGGCGLVALVEKLKFSQFLPPLLMTSVLAVVSLQAISWDGIYSTPHVYETASEWIYKNIPVNSKLAEMHWDDRLPLELLGHQAFSYRYLEIPIYENETPGRIDNILNMLSSADYLVFPSGRPYGAFPHAADQYPLTMSFFRELFAGQLGYQLVAKFKVGPSLSFLHFNDELADESFSLYDHPKVTIFKNEKRLSLSELNQIIQKSGSVTDQDWKMFMLH